MMDKELIINNARKKFSGELLEIVIEQINDFFTLLESNYIVRKKYEKNDSVLLNSNHLLHGIGKHTDIINVFAERGVTSPEYFDNSNEHAFCHVAAFWDVKDNISLKEYINNYSGMIAKVNDKYYQVPYKGLDSFVEMVRNKDHWLWTAESSMEIRFMPSLARNNNQIGFILNTENDIAKKMRKNSVFKTDFNLEYAFEFIGEKAQERFKKEGFIADFFERADYLIFGLPKNCIEGIIVGRKVENDNKSLNILKNLFPNCYICNLDGIVIVGNK